MDLTGIVVAIVAVNLITFLVGCVVAFRRYRRERADELSLASRGPAEPSVSTLPAASRHLDRPSR
jgi:hypothetical protein